MRLAIEKSRTQTASSFPTRQASGRLCRAWIHAKIQTVPHGIVFTSTKETTCHTALGRYHPRATHVHLLSWAQSNARNDTQISGAKFLGGKASQQATNETERNTIPNQQAHKQRKLHKHTHTHSSWHAIVDPWPTLCLWSSILLVHSAMKE